MSSRCGPAEAGREPVSELSVERAERLGHSIETLAAAGDSPLQRTLSLHGETGVQDRHLAHLNALLGSSGAQVKRDGDRVSFSSHPVADEGRKHAGYRLLRRLIDNQHDVRVGTHPDQPNRDAVAVPNNAEASFDKTRGSGSFVHLPAIAKPNQVTTFDKGTQEHVVEDSPVHLQLGHELIHADHIQRGVAVRPGNKVRRQLAGKLRGFGDFSTAVEEEREEGITIGTLPGENPSEDITENQLRASHGANPRAAHAEIAEHLTREHGGRLEELSRQHATVQEEIEKHEASARASNQAGIEAAHRLEEARKKGAEIQSSIDFDERMIKSFREDGDRPVLGTAVPGEQFALAHERSLADGRRRQEQHAKEIEAHTREIERHRAEFELHLANRARAAERAGPIRDEFGRLRPRLETLKKLISS